MSLISADQLISALGKKPHLDLDVPDLGTLRIRTIGGEERDEFEASIHFADGDPKKRFANMRAKLVALCLVDEAGNRLFNELDVTRLGKGNGALLDLIYAACRKHNRMTPSDQEELLKNSKAGQTGDSGSDSPATSA